MKKYKFGASYGFAGCRIDDVIEADCEEDAYEQAREMAFERVDYWIEEIEDDTE